MMIFKLVFTKASNKEWRKLGYGIRQQLDKKLQQRLQNPRVPKDKLREYKNLYKIKLKKSGYRLIYEVKDQEIIILVLTIAKRENNQVYRNIH
ncbi:MAG: mRNA interferase toxin RelE [Catillopecten margaritatus gill symbiont]|uniref:mRNA interferase toxin RelE n=1 Tax=Catillopecten margaritatus gill symbiont TaxID=3083288 RepID=A0AAU6PFV8_9GAMM